MKTIKKWKKFKSQILKYQNTENSDSDALEKLNSRWKKMEWRTTLNS